MGVDFKREYQAILDAETSASGAMKRRVLRDERLKLQSALQAKPFDRGTALAQAAECQRVRLMWEDDEPTEDKYGNPIKHGYTFEAWLRAAGRQDSASMSDLRAAWDAGEEPSVYEAE